MARAATSRVRFNPPIGSMPVLQFVPLDQLQIDATYQRSIETPESQTLIRKIAQHWNWDLCQPLVVSRRTDRALFVIDGQHRLAAGRMRGDIFQLPCVVVDYQDARDEAASFVHLNQQRRRLTKLEIFKAALASGDAQAVEIAAALEAAGLGMASHSNNQHMRPGDVASIGGIEAAWRRHGGAVAGAALRVLALAYPKQVLRYAGSIYPGIVAVVVREMKELDRDGMRLRRIASVVGGKAQHVWFHQLAEQRVRDPNMTFAKASVAVLCAAWDAELGITPAALSLPRILSTNHRRMDIRGLKPSSNVPSIPFKPDGLGDGPRGLGDGCAWCEQCEMRISAAQFATCKSRFCSLRKRG